MELRHLRTFLVLSELKNFTRTAESLHYAQSYVTTQIRQLEEELDVRLFERLGRNIALTPDGMALIPYARQMLAVSEDLRLRFSSRETGRLTVGAAESICIGILPDMIEQFQCRYPDIELYLQVLDTDDVAALLGSNTIDLAFVLDTAVSSPSLTNVLQADETISAFAAPGHPLLQKKQLSARDFSGQPLILTGQGCRYRKCFEQDLAKAAVMPKIVLETGSIQVIRQTAASGLGICILPLSAVRQELDCGKLVRLDYEMNYGIQAQLIYHKDKWLSKGIKGFIAILKESYPVF